MKLITLLCAISLLTACQGKPNHNFTVKGNIKNFDKPIALFEMGGKIQKYIQKIHLSENGDFNLTINADKETIYAIAQEDSFNNILVYFINDNSNITINTDEEKNNEYENAPFIEGSKASIELTNLLVFRKQQEKKLMDILIESNDGTEATIKKYRAAFRKEMVSYYGQIKHPLVQIFATYFILGVSFNKDEREEVNNLVKRIIQQHSEDKYIQQEAKYMQQIIDKSLADNKLPSFSLPNTEGKIVNIDAFKGQYFLLDFWASWCGPCRQENPYLVKAFNRFKNKNFTIVGVSLDDDKDAWLNTIAKDNLTWTHLSDLKGWESQAAQLFHINAIPFNLLVDPQGNIIASELRGEMLEQKLEEILK